MQSTDDSALLRQYLEDHSDAAFAALVRRHINLVYSVALRHVGDPHQAEEITQAVFILLAKKAAQLRHDKALSSWLFQATRLTASNFVRGETRRQRREQEAHMQAVLDESRNDTWRQIAPLLDTAVASLSEKDRQAIMLRFYEGRNLRDVGAALGASEDAAEKRVSRAVERLREFFAKHGVTVGASGLVVVISANAVQAAPVGLAVTISTAAALAGTSIAATTTAAAAKAIAMTTLQKTIIGATLIAAGTGIYEARLAANLRSQIQTLQQQRTPWTEQIQQLQRERDDATSKLVALQKENEELRGNIQELAKLRSEHARTGARAPEQAQLKPAAGDMNDPFTRSVLAMMARALELNQHLEQMPDQKIPELQLLTENDWLSAAKEAKFDTDADVRKALSKLRNLAKDKLPIGSALYSFTQANNGQLPADLSQLRPYFKLSVDDAILERYKLLHTGNLSEFQAGKWFVLEKAPVDKEYDSLAVFGNGFSTSTRP